MTLPEAKILSSKFIKENYSDPIILYKMGRGEVCITDIALIEILEYTTIAKDLNPDLIESTFFVKLLNKIILEKNKNVKK